MNRRTFRAFMVTSMCFLVASTCTGVSKLGEIRARRSQNVVIESSQIDQIVEALKPTPVVVKPTPVTVNVTPRLDTSDVTDKLRDLVIQTIRIRGAVERTATSTHHLVLMGHSQGASTEVPSPKTDVSEGSIGK